MMSSIFWGVCLRKNKRAGVVVMQQRLAQLRRLRRRALKCQPCGTHNAGAKKG